MAEQQKKTIKIKKDTEKMKAISDAEREKEVKDYYINLNSDQVQRVLKSLF